MIKLAKILKESDAVHAFVADRDREEVIANSMMKDKVKEQMGEGGTNFDINTIVSNKYIELANQWIAFIDNSLKGKSIRITASKKGERGHDWKVADIRNIKETKLANYFGTEVSVKDENGDWFTILSDDHNGVAI